MTLYPNGYGTQTITLERMRELHEPNMHPEFARRFFAYIKHKNGLLGVGGGHRTTQPTAPGFAPPGKSFHETQHFASGINAYSAVDLVATNPGNKHRSPTWAETDDAPTYGLHTFINGEPWHIQCIEMRGWQTWINAGRPDPQPFTLPTDPQELPMRYIAQPPPERPDAPWLVVWEGAVRYATNIDTQQGLPFHVLNAGQYDWLLKSAGLA